MRAKRVSTIVAVLVSVAAACALLASPVRDYRRSVLERRVGLALKSLVQAEVDLLYKSQQFWTADVAGLRDQGLIEKDLGGADPTRLGARPFNGYWFIAMDLDEDGRLYRQGDDKTRNRSKFGFCAYPASKEPGARMLLVNQENLILYLPFAGIPRYAWPPK